MSKTVDTVSRGGGLRAVCMGAGLFLASLAPAYAACPAWTEGNTYNAGTVVSYSGANYTALITHTAYAGTNWNPAATPALWQSGGTCSTTPTPPPTTPPPTTPPPVTPPPTTTPGLPKHALVGYWHNFTNPSGNTFRLRDVPGAWDVVVVAFGDDAGNGNVSFTVDPHAGTEAEFVQDVDALRARGKKVVLSLGGQNGTVTLNNATHVGNFVNSLHGIINRFHFDGIDIDLESGSGISHGAPIINNLVTAVKQLRARVGSGFYLSMAPEHPYVHGGYVAYGSIWGAYLPIIDGLRNELNVIHVQYYNNGGLYTPYASGPYAEGTADMLVAGSKMLIEGFPLANGSAGRFAGLRPDQVAFGVPSGRSSANSGFVTPATVNQALNCLTKLENCGGIRPNRAYPDFRGVMTWSINWDRHDGFNFSAPVSAHLRSLP